MKLLAHSALGLSDRRLVYRILGKILHIGVSSLSCTQTFLIRALSAKPRSITGKEIRRVLIIKLDELGDSVMVWPLVNDLRTYLPDAEITLLLNQSVVGLWGGVAGIRIMGVDVSCRKLLRPFLLPIRHFRLVRRHFRQEEFDVCFVPRRDSDDVYATFLAYFTRSKRRISFTEKSTPRKALTNKSFDSMLTDALPAPPVQHETLSNRSMLAAIGLSARSRQQPFPTMPETVAYAEGALPGPSSSYVAVCPTSGHSALKQWGVERFADAASRLIEAGFIVVLLGGPGDMQLAQVIQDGCNGKCINFVGKTSLSQMVALLSRCGSFLGNDAGPMHVASALGLVTVGVFGSSCWHQFGPWAPRHSVVVHEMNCSPCHVHARNRCDICIYGEPVCLHQITVDEVLEALLANIVGRGAESNKKALPVINSDHLPEG